jgi:hypothetical protein
LTKISEYDLEKIAVTQLYEFFLYFNLIPTPVIIILCGNAGADATLSRTCPKAPLGIRR